MDARQFDAIARLFSAAGRTRRGLLGLLATLPVLGSPFALIDPDDAAGKGRRKRRKKRHKHGKGRHKGKHKKKKCKPNSQAKTCAGKCGSVKNNCKKTVDCGSCDCDPPCEVCFTCQGEPAACVQDAPGTPCGDSGQVCQPDGTCACVSGECCTNAECSGTTPICDAAHTCEACTTDSECGANARCLEDGSCQACDVTCDGTPAECGAALQTAMNAGGTLYVCPGTYQGGFVISSSVTVIGAGDGENDANSTILSGNKAARVVQIPANTGLVTLQRLRITDGKTPEAHDSNGAGINHRGSTLVMSDCTVTGSTGTNAYGGGIFCGSGRTLQLTRCTISANHADGGRIGGHGGGISAEGAVTLTDCVVEFNSASLFGGGLAAEGTMTLAGSTIVRDNVAPYGGGIFAYFGLVEIAETCRVTENRAAVGNGGGIDNLSGEVTLQGADPSPIVVANCHENCRGDVPKCAAGGTCPP